MRERDRERSFPDMLRVLISSGSLPGSPLPHMWRSVLAQGQPIHWPSTLSWLTKQQQGEPWKQKWHQDIWLPVENTLIHYQSAGMAGFWRSFNQGSLDDLRWGESKVSLRLSCSLSAYLTHKWKVAWTNQIIFPNTPTWFLKTVHSRKSRKYRKGQRRK